MLIFVAPEGPQQRCRSGAVVVASSESGGDTCLCNMDWEGEGKVMPDFDKLENQQRLGAQQEGDLPLWAARQQKVFTNWINNKVST